jgi:hypothetical protein
MRCVMAMLLLRAMPCAHNNPSCSHCAAVVLQAAAAGAVSLTTPPAEVDTYAELAALLPFTDDTLAEALAQLLLEEPG